jgi:hypothetical protein
MARRVPRLSEYYELSALYFFNLGHDAQCWFQLFAAWFYEDEDEREWNGGRFGPPSAQMELTLDPWE